MKRRDDSNVFHTESDDSYPRITYRFTVEFDEVAHLDGWLATGDDEQDRKDTQEVIRRIDRGDVWAWAFVKCEASVDNSDDVTFTGDASLGGCCYSDARDFLASEKDNLMSEARHDLIEQLKRAQRAGDVALYFRQQLSLKGVS